MNTRHFSGRIKKPSPPQTMCGTVEQANKTTALARCTECRKGGAPCLTPMGNGKGWASQTIDSHD